MAQSPSEILNSLYSLHDPADFYSLLRTQLYPFLDALPPEHRQALIRRLSSAANAISGIGLIAFEKRSKSIQEGIKELKKHVKSDWKYGYETQGEMMTSIVQEIGSWLPDLWIVSVDQGSEHKLVHKSLKVCYKAFQDLGNTNSRTEFSDLDDPEIQIKDGKGIVVYKVDSGTTDHAIFWVWRDLLLSAAVLPVIGMDLVGDFVADLDGLGLSNCMLERLDEEISEPPQLKEIPFDMNDKTRDSRAEERRDLLLNAHLPPEMRTLIPAVKEVFITRFVAQFERNPSLQLFRSIISINSQLKDQLLSVARERFLKPKDQWTSLADGFGIFESVGADEELLQLFKLATSSDYSRHITDDIQQKALSHLGTRPLDVRTTARPYLEHRLLDSVKCTIEEIKRVFPKLINASKTLQRDLAKSKLTNSVPAQPQIAAGRHMHHRSGIPPRHADPARDPILKKFCQKAGWAPASESDSDEDMDDDIYDSDGDYMDEDREVHVGPSEKEDISDGAIIAIQHWAKVLEGWPDQSERDAMKKAVRESFEDGQFFFKIDGVADVLARRCDYGASDPCRQRLGRAIRELYFNFAVDGAEKDRIRTDMPKTLSFTVVW